MIFLVMAALAAAIGGCVWLDRDRRRLKEALSAAQREIKETTKLRKTALAALRVMQPKLAGAEAARVAAQNAIGKAATDVAEAKRRETVLRHLAERLLRMDPMEPNHLQRRRNILQAMRAELGPPPEDLDETPEARA